MKLLFTTALLFFGVLLCLSPVEVEAVTCRLEVFAFPLKTGASQVLRWSKGWGGYDKLATHGSAALYEYDGDKINKVTWLYDHGKAPFHGMSAVGYLEKSGNCPTVVWCDLYKLNGTTSNYGSHVCNSDVYAHMLSFSSNNFEDKLKTVCFSMYTNVFTTEKYISEVGGKQTLSHGSSLMWKISKDTKMIDQVKANVMSTSELAKRVFGTAHRTATTIERDTSVSNNGFGGEYGSSAWNSQFDAAKFTGLICEPRKPDCRDYGGFNSPSSKQQQIWNNCPHTDTRVKLMWDKTSQTYTDISAQDKDCNPNFTPPSVSTQSTVGGSEASHSASGSGSKGSESTSNGASNAATTTQQASQNTAQAASNESNDFSNNVKPPPSNSGSGGTSGSSGGAKPKSGKKKKKFLFF